MANVVQKRSMFRCGWYANENVQEVDDEGAGVEDGRGEEERVEWQRRGNDERNGGGANNPKIASRVAAVKRTHTGNAMVSWRWYHKSR